MDWKVNGARPERSSRVHFSLAQEETLMSCPLSGREAVAAALPTAQASAGAGYHQTEYPKGESPLPGSPVSSYSILSKTEIGIFGKNDVVKHLNPK
jgi:hypothetical protein